jgi:hypothetical protein
MIMMVSFVTFVWTAAFLVTSRLVSNWLKLRSVPGPLLAATSDLWRAFHQYRGTLGATLENLHTEYGPVIRYGVRSVSISDPNAVTTIYESRSGFVTVWPIRNRTSLERRALFELVADLTFL